MRKKESRLLTFILMTAVTALAVWCCEEPVQPVDKSVSVSVRTTQVDNREGSTFVSVKTEGAWVLSLSFEDGQEAWAELSMTSGKG